MNILIKIKSGTGGYYDYDGCDLLIKRIEDAQFPIPRIGEMIKIPACRYCKDYLVKDVLYLIDEGQYSVSIYVIPLGEYVP